VATKTALQVELAMSPSGHVENGFMPRSAERVRRKRLGTKRMDRPLWVGAFVGPQHRLEQNEPEAGPRRLGCICLALSRSRRPSSNPHGSPRKRTAARRRSRARSVSMSLTAALTGLDNKTPTMQDFFMASAQVRKLLAEAAQLPTAERREIVDELAQTLPEQTEGDDTDLDYDELDRRMESVRSGTAVLVPWEEARKQLLGG
jgi:putative addiction module component (TIGR02574 family)